MKTRRATKAIAHVGDSGANKRLPRQRSTARRMEAAVKEHGGKEHGVREQREAAGGEMSGERNGHQELDKVELLKALLAFGRGDFSVRLSPSLSGLDGKIADAFNHVLDISQKMARELERINHVVGTEGRLAQRANVGDVTGLRSEERRVGKEG